MRDRWLTEWADWQEATPDSAGKWQPRGRLNRFTACCHNCRRLQASACGLIRAQQALGVTQWQPLRTTARIVFDGRGVRVLAPLLTTVCGHFERGAP